MNPRLKNLLVIDVETTGLSLASDQITALALVPLDSTKQVFEAYVRTSETKEKLSGAARKYFGYYQARWEECAAPPATVLERLLLYIAQNFVGPVTLVGHNVSFDQAFLRKLAAEQEIDLESSISHRSVDTHSWLYLLYSAGEIPKEALSSSGAFREFAISVDNGTRHTALGDALGTRDLVLSLLKRIEALPGLKSRYREAV
jgi:DNA polymerase III subunit epsilon